MQASVVSMTVVPRIGGSSGSSNASYRGPVAGEMEPPSESRAARAAVGGPGEERFNRGRHEEQQARDAAAEQRARQQAAGLAEVSRLKAMTLNEGDGAQRYNSPMRHRLLALEERQAQAQRERELEERKQEEARQAQLRRGKAAARQAQEDAARAHQAEQRRAAAAAHSAKVSTEAEVRVRNGMPANVAQGATTTDRQHLSHTVSRGQWARVPTHFGVAVERWTGCRCGQEVRDSWCSYYTGPRPLEDAPSSDAQRGAAERALRDAAERVAAGMPPEMARGGSLQRRKWLSHTRNECQGVARCGKQGAGACKAKYVIDPDQSIEMWTCCKAVRRDFWCRKYEGPKM